MAKKDIFKDQHEMDHLFKDISKLVAEARKRISIAVNSEATILNYKVGQYIHEFILKSKRAPYSKEIISNLSDMLTQKFGSGWSEKHLFHCLRAAETFSFEQIVSAVQRQLSWTHIKTISYEKNELKRSFYLEMSIISLTLNLSLKAVMFLILWV